MTSATTGHGTLLKRGDGGGPEVFTTIAEVTDIGGPTLTRETPEATPIDAPGQWREFVAGLKDGGEVTFDLNYLPADPTQDAATGILSEFSSDTARNYQVVWPDPGQTTWAFAAFLTGFEPAAPRDDVFTASVTLKITGQPTIA